MPQCRKRSSGAARRNSSSSKVVQKKKSKCDSNKKNKLKTKRALTVVTRSQTAFLRHKNFDQLLEDKRGARAAMEDANISYPEFNRTITRGMFHLHAYSNENVLATVANTVVSNYDDVASEDSNFDVAAPGVSNFDDAACDLSIYDDAASVSNSDKASDYSSNSGDSNVSNNENEKSISGISDCLEFSCSLPTVKSEDDLMSTEKSEDDLMLTEKIANRSTVVWNIVKNVFFEAANFIGSFMRA